MLNILYYVYYVIFEEIYTIVIYGVKSSNKNIMLNKLKVTQM